MGRTPGHLFKAINRPATKALIPSGSRRTGYFRQRKKKVKTKIIYLDDAGKGKLLH